MPDLSSFAAALQIGGVMIYPLIALAMLATVIIVEKSYIYAARTRLPATLLALVETHGFAWSELDSAIAALGPRNYFEIGRASCRERLHISSVVAGRKNKRSRSQPRR